MLLPTTAMRGLRPSVISPRSSMFASGELSPLAISVSVETSSHTLSARKSSHDFYPAHWLDATSVMNYPRA